MTLKTMELILHVVKESIIDSKRRAYVCGDENACAAACELLTKFEAGYLSLEVKDLVNDLNVKGRALNDLKAGLASEFFRAARIIENILRNCAK